MNILGVVSLVLILSIFVYAISNGRRNNLLQKIVEFSKCVGFVLTGVVIFTVNMLAMNWLYSVMFIGTSMLGQ